MDNNLHASSIPCLSRVSVWLALAAGWLTTALADGPTLKQIFPAGAGRGQSVEVTALGEPPTWPVTVWCDDPAIKWEPTTEKGKFKVAVDSKALLGIHHVRLVGPDNASQALRFMIGPIPEQNEAEPNDAATDLQPVEGLPKVVNGIISQLGDVDTFAVDLEDQQILIAAIEAHQNLKSPVDMTVQVVSSAGVVLAQNMDAYGLDPMIEFQAPRKGRYFVRLSGQPSGDVKTSAPAATDHSVYRLSLAHGGWLKATRPLGIDPKTQNTLTLHGIQVPAEPVTVKVPPRYEHPCLALDLPGLAHAPLIDLVDMEHRLEGLRPNSGVMPDLKFPIAMTGALGQVRERDFYSFTAVEDRKLRFTLTSRRLGLPLQGVLRVLALSGKELARQDDANEQNEACLVFEPPLSGQYVLEVSDAIGYGGPDWIYRVDATPVIPDVILSVKDDHLTTKVNEQIEILVTIDRRDGFDKSIELVAMLPDGQTISPLLKSTATENAREGKIVLKSTLPHSGPFRIIARSKNDSNFKRTATCASDDWLKDLWLIVK